MAAASKQIIMVFISTLRKAHANKAIMKISSPYVPLAIVIVSRAMNDFVGYPHCEESVKIPAAIRFFADRRSRDFRFQATCGSQNHFRHEVLVLLTAQKNRENFLNILLSVNL
jgi:hypothetical protein